MSSNTQVLRDPNGKRIGEIETGRDGILVLRNANGTRLGTYEPKANVTRDASGHRIGEGNQLVTLLRS